MFKFGCNFQRWISVVYNNVQSAVNGGRMTDYFEITRAVIQGCPLSPSLFILTVELLALKLRQSPDCRGLRLPNDKEARISQFADNTTIITNSRLPQITSPDYRSIWGHLFVRVKIK